MEGTSSDRAKAVSKDPSEVAGDALPAVSTAALIDQITELAGHLNAGTYRWLTLIAEFDRRLGWNCGLTKTARTGSTGSAASIWARRARRCGWRTRSSRSRSSVRRWRAGS